MKTQKRTQQDELQQHLPSVETIQQELGKAQSTDDFFGKEDIFARVIFFCFGYCWRTCLLILYCLSDQEMRPEAKESKKTSALVSRC